MLRRRVVQIRVGSATTGTGFFVEPRMESRRGPGARARTAGGLPYVSRGERSVLEGERPAGGRARDHLLRRVTRAWPGQGAGPAATRLPGGRPGRAGHRRRGTVTVRAPLGRAGRGMGDHRRAAPGPDVPAAAGGVPARPVA